MGKIYVNKDGRSRIAIKQNNKRSVISYPRYLMEEFLGRPLEDNEQVHHIDGDYTNNDISNLEVITFEEHLKYHGEQNRKYFDIETTCFNCGKRFIWTAKQQSSFYRNRNRSSNLGPHCSRSCSSKTGRKIQLQRL